MDANDKLRNFTGEASTVTLTVWLEEPPPPKHWAWHPLVRRFLWPIWERLGFVWFMTTEGEFYFRRWRG